MPRTPRFNPPATSTVIARGTGWNFHALARDLGTAWRGSAYADSAWQSGRAGIGFGTTVATTLPYTTNPKPLTTWLRKDFAIADAPAAIASLTASVNYNDGFIAYLNGTEVARRSLPASVTASTPATPHAHGTFETLDLTAFKNLLARGRNVLAIEPHLASTSDTDAYFDADLAYTRPVTTNDTDADDIPEAWEDQFGLDKNDPADAALDADGDGQSNLAEYLAGTNPRDAADVLRVSISPGGGAQVLRFTAVAGKTYIVQYKTALSDATWLKLADVAGQLTTREIEVQDNAATGQTQRFYRVVTPAVP